MIVCYLAMVYYKGWCGQCPILTMKWKASLFRKRISAVLSWETKRNVLFLLDMYPEGIRRTI